MELEYLHNDWEDNTCDNCGKDIRIGIKIQSGVIGNYDFHAIWCRECLEKAIALIDKELEDG